MSSTRFLSTAAAALGVVAVGLTACGSEQAPDAGSPEANRATGSKTRTYYIAADEVAWNYAPAGRNLISDSPFTEEERVFVERGPERIGSTYVKAIYRQYTGPDFRQRVDRPDVDSYLGSLGPTIRAEVGDTVRVVFRNNASFPATMHPHGFRYGKESEGAAYNDGVSPDGKRGDKVEPGATFTYTWHVPAESGPADGDPSSIAWMYHSHVNEPADTNAGLVGPIVVTRAGEARPDGSPKDVDRELAMILTVDDENASHYLEQNIRRYAGRPAAVHRDDEEFVESNLMHSINGFVYGNQPMPQLRVGDRVRWYVLNLGSEVDLHTPHWHGNTILSAGGMRQDSLSLLPGDMVVADMVPRNRGIWLLHCHVNDHITAGMLTRYQVS